jgi:hypothetical protein
MALEPALPSLQWVMPILEGTADSENLRIHGDNSARL